MRHAFFDVPVPTIIGHRGACASAPENTLESFAAGLACGAQILEGDVHQTRDGVPVLSHDASLARMTGRHAEIADLDLTELRELDASFGFANTAGDVNPSEFQGLHVPTLEEVFQQFATARFNLEIKVDAPGIVEAVIALIEQYRRAELTLLAAEKDELMQRIHAELKRSGARPAIGASVGDVLAFVRAAVAKEPPASEAMALQIPVEFGGRPLVTPQLIDHAHEYGTAVHVWTINETEEMDRLLDLGVDGLITDHPARMRELLARR